MQGSITARIVLVMCVIMEPASGTMLNDTSMDEHGINRNDTRMHESLNKNISTIKTEDYIGLLTMKPYTVKDLLMSLGLLLLLVILFCIWYSLARLCIYLVYHKTHQRIKKLEEAECEDEVITNWSKEEQEDYQTPCKLYRSKLVGSSKAYCQLLEAGEDEQES